MNRRPLLAGALLVAVTLLVYIPAMRGGYFWDDYTYLVRNPLLEAPDALRRIWFTTDAPEYFPLSWTTHWVDGRLWGGHPEGPHAVNVLLHAAAAVLLWRVLKRLRVPGAWPAALLFAVHPACAASAAWIMERKNVLSMAFFAASLLAFLNCEDRKGALSLYFSSLALFLLALLSKTSVVMLPAVLLLCAWWRRGKITRKDLLRSAPFFALSIALGLVTFWFQRHNAIHGEIVRPEGAASRVAAAGWIAWFYFFKVLLPAGLCVIYPRWTVDGSGVLPFLPLVLLVGGMVFLWTRRTSWGRAPFFASAYFLLMLLPVLGFLDMAFMRLSLVSDHLQYAAMIGVIAFAAGALCNPAVLGWQFRAAACVAVLAFLTWGRASLYSDDGAALWRDNLRKNPANPAAWVAWHHLGDICARAQDYEGAIRDFDHVIALNPAYAQAWYNRANANFRLGRYDPALSDCDRAISLQPRFAAAYNGRALIRYAMKDYTQALADVAAYRKLGGRPDPSFLDALTRAAHSGP